MNKNERINREHKYVMNESTRNKSKTHTDIHTNIHKHINKWIHNKTTHKNERNTWLETKE